LRSGETPDLQTALSQRLQASASRFGFEVDVIATGQPRPLLWSVQRHILYIFREALTNVEKHSGAQQVRLYLAWTDDMLTIRLVDEGHGFDRDKVYANGHYGLAIMEERAGEVGGQLAVTSSPEAGTEVSFSLPLSPGCVVAQGSKP
jgi:signal transduction histidine kinase